MKEHAFAVVTGFGEQFPVASHLPLHFEQRSGKVFLSGHLMKNTDHHKAFEKNERVLVIFNGPHCFVSAAWYDNPLEGSTWNYMAVHAKGRIRFTDEAGTYRAIKSITDKYVGTGTPASFDKLPEEYITRLMKAIVGFEIEVEHYENVFKLSQNHHASDQKSIIDHLKQSGDTGAMAIAIEMEKRMAVKQPGK